MKERSLAGKLIVFEGPDGVGKSTLHSRALDSLVEWGLPTMGFAFPGNDSGTLGKLVYSLHHGESDLPPESIDPLSLQTMHVAAHIDAITSRILPELEAGRHVLLDRFWWSTWVYGTTSGVPKASMRALMRLEQQVWGDTKPSVAFLVTRTVPFRQEHAADRYDSLLGEYERISEESPGTIRIRNEGSLQAAVDQMRSSLRDALGLSE